MDITNSERRAHQRYLAPSLSIVLKSVRPNDEDISSVHLSTLDFNCFGMAVQSPHNFKIGDELRVAISDGQHQAVDVVCCVCNRAKTASGYRCGLHFLDQGVGDIRTRQSLISMERQLDEVLHNT